MALALGKNIGAYAWLEEHGVLRLRTKCDMVIGAVTPDAVMTQSAKSGVPGKVIPFADLLAVALPNRFPGAEQGTPVPAEDVPGADMVLVVDKPFESVWPKVRDGGRYFWRDSAAYDLYNHMYAVSFWLADLSDDEDSDKRQKLGTELAELGQQVLEKEPGTEEPSFFYMLASAHDALQNVGAAEVAYARALELNVKRGGLVPAALRNATRQLGILLAIRGNQNDDVQVMRRALGLLDSISSDLDSDARQVRDMLRGAIQQAEAPSGGPSPQRPSSTPSQETTQGAKKGCFIATAVYGSPLAAEVNTLCEFRDRVLFRSPLGRSFIRFYYWASPPFAKHIGSHDGLREVVRACLIVPLLRMARKRLAKK